MKTSITIVVVAKDHNDLSEFSSHQEVSDSGAQLVLVENSKGDSLAKVYNKYLDECKTKYIAFIHSDTTIGPDCINRWCALLGDRRVFTGIVGITKDGKYTWGKDLPNDVVVPLSTLDACGLVFNAEIAKLDGLSFDELAFDGFHCHTIDFILAGVDKGWAVEISHTESDHVGKSTGALLWTLDFYKYKKILIQKWWNKIPFLTT